MYAIIETGGKQYRVTDGDSFRVEKLVGEIGSSIEFEKILVVSDGKKVDVGAPYVDGAKVVAEIKEHGKGDKVIIFKYKAKKDYRKKQGHRQPYTLLEITSITSADGKTVKATPVAAPKKTEAKKADAPKAAEPKAEVKKSEPKAETKKAETPKDKEVSLTSMKKDELIEYAKEQNIKVDPKATKAVIIETIQGSK